MTIEKFEVERFSLTSSKPFDAVVAALKSAIGQPDVGRTDLMLFAEFDLGGVLRRELGSSKTPKIMRFVVGNPLIMKEMVKHVPDAGSYPPSPLGS